MTKSAFLRKLEEIVELNPGSLKGGEKLGELEGWDSLKIVEFLAFADEEFSLAIPPRAMGSCKTVQDLAGLLAPHVDV